MTEIERVNEEIERLRGLLEDAITNRSHTQTDLTTLENNCALILVNIQHLVRQIYHNNKTSALETSVKKQQTNQKFLALQNLNFERAHILKEIENAMNVETIYQKVPLILEEEYLNISKDANTGSQLMVNRLQHELDSRKALENKEKELLKQKRQMEEKYLAMKTELEGSDREFENYLNASKTLQKRLNIDLDEKNIEDVEMENGETQESS
jgi:THO complex subunit 5